MNNLILDFGNTYQKVAIVKDGETIFFARHILLGLPDIASLEEKFSFQRVILASVIEKDEIIETYLRKKYEFIKLTHQTPLPIINQYQTLKTLGYDRIACAVAANHLFHNRACLIIQMGSCITFDFINDKREYLGGGISPGLHMRLNALHHFTKKLPLITYEPIDFLIGDTTEKSILSGVINGIINECNGIIAKYTKQFSDIKIILTGGDMSYFEKSLKNEIFAHPNLVILGLSLILNYNVEYQNKN